MVRVLLFSLLSVVPAFGWFGKKDVSLEGIWCLQDNAIWVHEYEPKNANVVTYQCYQFKTVEKGIRGEIGAGRWLGYWYFNQAMPAKIHPLHLKVEDDPRYHSQVMSPGLFTYYRLPNGAMHVKMISLVNKNSSADLHVHSSKKAYLQGYKYPQDLDVHQSYVVSAKLSKMADDLDDKFFEEAWKTSYSRGQAMQKKMKKVDQL